MTVLPRNGRYALYLIAFALLGTLVIASSSGAATMLGSAFVSRGCDLEPHGELLDGMAMPGTPLGEVRFAVECQEFGEFRLTVLISGSAEFAAAIDVDVSLGEQVLYRGPLSELAITQRLTPGSSEIIVRSALASDYGGGGRIGLNLLADVAGI